MMVKKRIGITLTKYHSNGIKSLVSRRVPARIRDLIQSYNGKMSVKVTYKKGVSNETIVSDDKNYLLKTLSAFTTKDLIKDALSY